LDTRPFSFELNLTTHQQKEMRTYLDTLPTEMIMFALRFAYNRERAIRGGYLMPGRKSIVKKETHLLNDVQATWRLNHWKAVIRSYRDKGYSYPTISRIKRRILKIAKENGDKFNGRRRSKMSG
jgi:hypothetical protein